MSIKKLINELIGWYKEKGERPSVIAISHKAFADLEADEEALIYIETNIVDDRIIGYKIIGTPFAITDGVEGYKILSLEEHKALASLGY